MKHLKLYESFIEDKEIADYLEKVHFFREDEVEKELKFMKEMGVTIDELMTYRIVVSDVSRLHPIRDCVIIAVNKILHRLYHDQDFFKDVLKDSDFYKIKFKDSFRNSQLTLDLDGVVIDERNFLSHQKYFISVTEIKTHQDLIEFIFCILDWHINREDIDLDKSNDNAELLLKNILKNYPELLDRFKYLLIDTSGKDPDWVERVINADKHKDIMDL